MRSQTSRRSTLQKGLPVENELAFTLVELLVVMSALAILGYLLLPPFSHARHAAYRAHCKNNLKQIAQALHAYAEDHGSFPPAYTTDADGRALHSWRTLILPYLGHEDVYARIDLSKPWDDPVNVSAAPTGTTAVPEYTCVELDQEETEAGKTSYLAVVGPEFMIRPPGADPVTVEEISESQAVRPAVFDVDQGSTVHWMSPFDVGPEYIWSLRSDPTHLHDEDRIQAVFDDGRVMMLSTEISSDIRDALLEGRALDW